jgi:hypothetical protein
MQPYTGSEPDSAQYNEQSPPSPAPVHPLEDLRNLMLIACGWIMVLLILPPQHEYPIIDDWIYAGSVRNLLDTGTFFMPQQSQANLIGLTYWGAGWSKLFGFSFTTLTYSTLFFSFVTLFLFYGIARLLGTPQWGALLGTALLAYNPIFVHLSYSFMTDVPFIALMLLACFCYILGLQGRARYSRLWLLVGGLFTGWAFLIRQFGVVIPLAFALYLVLDMILTRRLRLRDLLGVTVLPFIIIAAWQYATRDVPTTQTSLAAASRAANFMFKETWPRVIVFRSFVLLPLIALFAWTAIKIRRARWWLIALSAVTVVVLLFTLDLPGEEWTQVGIPAYTAHIGPLDINFSSELFTFGLVGNIIRVTGIDFFEYPHEAVLTPEFWHILWIAGLVLGVLLLASIGDNLLDWLRGLRRGHSLSPITALYFLGAGIFLISMAVLGDLFDRYIFTVLPFIILFVVRGCARWGRLAWTYSLVALALITTFTLLAKADNIDHDNVRWQAGYWMLQRTGAVHVGFDFNNWNGQMTSDNYAISDYPQPEFGYRVEKAFPYFSRLGGFTTHYLYAQSSVNVPPLLAPTQTPTPP